jgi:glycosyl transferase family 25
LRVIVISLPDATDRRRVMRERLGKLGLEYEFLDAVRGTDVYGDPGLYDKAKALKAEGRELYAGEVGCALSHAKAYREIVRRGLPWALVLEDDAVLHERLPDILERLEAGILEQGDLVFLERCDYVRPGSARALFGAFRIAEPILVRAGATAQAAGYVVTRTAAEAIMARNVPVHFPADSWGYYLGLVRYRGIQPTLTLIRQDTSFGSTTRKVATRPVFRKNPLWRLVAHDFLTYTSIGRVFMRPLRVLLKRT